MTATRTQEPAISSSHLPGQASLLERVLRAREITLVVLIVVLVAVTTARHHDFLFSSDGWRELLRQPTILILIGVGEALVIITRNIDVSVGSILGLTTYFAGWLFHTVDGIPIVVVVAAAVALGVVLGLFNTAVLAGLPLVAAALVVGSFAS